MYALLMKDPKYLNYLYYLRYFDPANNGHGSLIIKKQIHGI